MKIFYPCTIPEGPTFLVMSWEEIAQEYINVSENVLWSMNELAD